MAHRSSRYLVRPVAAMELDRAWRHVATAELRLREGGAAVEAEQVFDLSLKLVKLHRQILESLPAAGRTPPAKDGSSQLHEAVPF